MDNGEVRLILVGRVRGFHQWIKVVLTETGELLTAYADRRLERDMGGDRGRTKSKASGNGASAEMIVHYAPDSHMLSIHNGLWTSDGETITKELTVFYDAEGHPAGFVLDTAEFQLKPFLDAVRAKSRGCRHDHPR